MHLMHLMHDEVKKLCRAGPYRNDSYTFVLGIDESSPIYWGLVYVGSGNQQHWDSLPKEHPDKQWFLAEFGGRYWTGLGGYHGPSSIASEMLFAGAPVEVVKQFLDSPCLYGVCGTSIYEKDRGAYVSESIAAAWEGVALGAGRLAGGAKNWMSVPQPVNAKLQQHVTKMYVHANKPNTIGNGTIMDAARAELRLSGSGPHVTKAFETRRGLRRWLNSSAGKHASDADRKIAQDLFDELNEILS